MLGRTAKFVPTIFVNILAGLLLTTVASSQPATSEGCLSAPWGDAPAGSHWRYHIDHANKSKCWFLRRDGGGLSQAEPQNNTATAQEITPPAPAAPSPPPVKPSVADARAEFRPKDNSVLTPPANAAGYPSNASVSEASPVAAAPAWNATAAVATRWPDPTVTSPQPGPAPAAATAVNDAPRPFADPSQAILPTIPFTNLAVPIQPGTIAGLIAAAIVALVFAALFARRRLTRRVRRRVARSANGPLWETTDDDRIVVSDQSHPEGRGYRFARGVPSVAARRAREVARRPPRHASW